MSKLLALFFFAFSLSTTVAAPAAMVDYRFEPVHSQLPIDAERATVYGQLTLRGVTQQVQLALRIEVEGQRLAPVARRPRKR